jgi:hypothetical protein
MKKSLFLLILALIGINSCRNNSMSPQGSGTIAGRVILFDSTYSILTDFSGVNVSVDGTTISMVTDSTGDWQFSGLADGTYNITAAKPGCGAYHWYEQNINNGRIDEFTVALAQMPSYTPVATGGGYDTTYRLLGFGILGAYAQLPTGVNIASYCDLDSNVQPSDAHLMVAVNTDDNSGGGGYFSYNDLLAAGARPGQTLYFSAANVFIGYNGYSSGYQATFGDPSHNDERRFASNGPKSNVVTFTMP